MSSSADASAVASEEDLTKKSLFLVESAKKSVEEASGASSLAQMVAMNVRMVSGMMGELARGMENVVTNTDESRNQIEQIETETTKTRDCLKVLTKTVEDIASSAKIIRGVAGQTNMLALNATIEAARAGEHGRGFAVVAGEVKALAKQTAETTSDIDAQLAAIRLAATHLGESLVQVNDSFAIISGRLNVVSTAVRQQSESFSVMNTYASEAAGSVEEIVSTLDNAVVMEQSMVSEITALCDLLKK